ncbi:hypothetical protein [Rhizobium mongolense]
MATLLLKTYTTCRDTIVTVCRGTLLDPENLVLERRLSAVDR